MGKLIVNNRRFGIRDRMFSSDEDGNGCCCGPPDTCCTEPYGCGQAWLRFCGDPDARCFTDGRRFRKYRLIVEASGRAFYDQDPLFLSTFTRSAAVGASAQFAFCIPHGPPRRDEVRLLYGRVGGAVYDSSRTKIRNEQGQVIRIDSLDYFAAGEAAGLSTIRLPVQSEQTMAAPIVLGFGASFLSELYYPVGPGISNPSQLFATSNSGFWEPVWRNCNQSRTDRRIGPVTGHVQEENVYRLQYADSCQGGSVTMSHAGFLDGYDLNTGYFRIRTYRYEYTATWRREYCFCDSGPSEITDRPEEREREVVAPDLL